MVRRKLSALVAIALMTASTAAVAQTAQPLSLANAPAASSAGEASQLDSRNGYGIYIVGAIVIALLVFGALELFGGDDEDEATSP